MFGKNYTPGIWLIQFVSEVVRCGASNFQEEGLLSQAKDCSGGKMQNVTAVTNDGHHLITEISSTVDDKRRLYQVKVNNAMLQHRLQVDINDRFRIFRDQMNVYDDEIEKIRQELIKVRSRSLSVDQMMVSGGIRDPTITLQKKLIIREIDARRKYNQSQFFQARAEANREQRLHQSRDEYVTIKKRMRYVRKKSTHPEG